MLSIPQTGKILDLRFFYTPAQALEYLGSLKVGGQGDAWSRYWMHEWLDLGFMAFYTMAMVAFWKATPRLDGLRRLRWLPWGAGALDLIETASILVVLSSVDAGTGAGAVNAALAGVMAVATPGKYVCFYSTLVAIVVHRLVLPRLGRSL